MRHLYCVLSPDAEQQPGSGWRAANTNCCSIPITLSSHALLTSPRHQYLSAAKVQITLLVHSATPRQCCAGLRHRARRRCLCLPCCEKVIHTTLHVATVHCTQPPACTLPHYNANKIASSLDCTFVSFKFAFFKHQHSAAMQSSTTGLYCSALVMRLRQKRNLQQPLHAKITTKALPQPARNRSKAHHKPAKSSHSSLVRQPKAGPAPSRLRPAAAFPMCSSQPQKLPGR